MKLSIITINYNNISGLRRTIDSILSQKWVDFEWIIVDGGSTDGSSELIEQLALNLFEQGWVIEHFSGPSNLCINISQSVLSSEVTESNGKSIFFWCSERDYGIYNAMNKGILRAHGEYINFMNSGDTFASENTLYEVFEQKRDADIIYGYMMRKRIDGSLANAHNMKPFLSYRDFYYTSLGHQSTFTKKEVFYVVGGFDESYKILADWVFFIKALFFKNASYVFIPEKISVFEGGGVTDTPAAKEEILRIRLTYYQKEVSDAIGTADVVLKMRKFIFFRICYSILYRLFDLYCRISSAPKCLNKL